MSAPLVNVVTIRDTADTGGGNQDITTSKLNGQVPVAARILCIRAITDGTSSDHAYWSIGLTDGVNTTLTGGGHPHGLGTTNTWCWADINSSIIRLYQTNSSTVDMAADFVSFIPDGIRINWTTTPPAAYFIIAEFWAGDAVLANVASVALGNTVNSTIDVTAPNFEPDILINELARNSDGVANEDLIHSHGFVHNDGVGGITQAMNAYHWEENAVTTLESAAFRTDSGIGEQIVNSVNIDWYGEFSSFDSDGFSVTPRNNGANGKRMFTLSLSFSGEASSAVGYRSYPTSDGSNSYTGVGFQPQYVTTLPNSFDATSGGSPPLGTNTSYSGPAYWTFADSTDQYTVHIVTDDGQSTTDTESRSEAGWIYNVYDPGVLAVSASFTNFTSTGWDESFTGAQAYDDFFQIWLAVGESDDKIPRYGFTNFQKPGIV